MRLSTKRFVRTAHAANLDSRDDRRRPLHSSYLLSALTGEGKAAILASDDWPASRTARRKTTESSARGRGRRGLPRAGAALDIRRAGRAAHRSDPADSYAREGGCAGALWLCLFAGKTFF